ncbi:hypothetical protein [Sphingobium yanoikuyae]|uniref:hypothetical protein n=1 Tax=Sphingobium yanoikuyae TaxID=13690 RepID=UPI00242CF593|nr:hypothetical protein [Sphingobium yanoikuyae]
MSEKLIPEQMFDIPDDLEPAEFRHVCAQIAIQAVVHAMGSREVKPGHASISAPMLAEALALSIAMLISADDSKNTPRDIRMAGEQIGKMVGGFATILREGNDTTGAQMLGLLGLGTAKVN